MNGSERKDKLFALEGGLASILLLMMLAIAAVLIASSTAALAQQAVSADESSTEETYAEEEATLLDCNDFATQRSAQSLFELASEDRFNLDKDGDEVACETPQGRAAEDGTTLGAQTLEDLDCMDFPSQEAAQGNLRADPSDPNGLDPEQNGIACEITPADYENPATDLALVVGAKSDADLNCEDFEYQQEAQMVYFRDESDPNSLDEGKNGSSVCENLPVLASNAEVIRAQPSSEASPLAMTFLAQTLSYNSGVDLVLDLVALLLVGSGASILVLLWWRRRTSN